LGTNANKAVFCSSQKVQKRIGSRSLMEKGDVRKRESFMGKNGNDVRKGGQRLGIRLLPLLHI
jgi:hypothetical protein